MSGYARSKIEVINVIVMIMLILNVIVTTFHLTYIYNCIW